MPVRIVILASLLVICSMPAARCPGRLCGRGRGVEGDGYGQPERHRLHRTRAYGRVRPEQEHWRPHGRRQRDERCRVQARHQLREARRYDGPGLASNRHDASANGSGWPSADARDAQPDHHSRSGCRQLGAGVEHLDHAVGLLKGAAANSSTVRRQGGQQIVSFSPAGFTSPSGSSYTVTGYISNQNLITKVETRVDHAVVGDLLVEFEYSGYQIMNGLQVPTRVVQRQAGLPTFEASIESATPNPPTLAELLAPPTSAGGAPAPAARAAIRRAACRAHRRRGFQDRW